MRLLRALIGVFMSGCLAVTPAVAGQRGPHGPKTPVGPAVAPAHPAGTAVHPAHVLVPQKIVANPALVARLQPLLPSGMALASAATGFKNQGQFIATLHVSQNLRIPFAALKADMLGPRHDSLGQAIHVLRPSVKATSAVRRADQEAADDLKATRPAKTATSNGDR